MNPESPYQPQQPNQAPQTAGLPPTQPGQPQYIQSEQSPFAQPIQPAQSIDQPDGQQAGQPTGQYASQPAYQPAMPPVTSKPRGSKGWVIATVITTVLFIGAASAGVWAYMNYLDQKDNVDSKVSAAVSVAVKETEDKAAEHLLEVENTPNRQFVGPDDYGRLSFKYSKLWSVYVAKDASSGGSFEAYFNPVSVPAITSQQQLALRVLIEDKDYDKVIDSYKSLVSKGELKSSAVKADDQSGTRLDGAFSKDIKGSAVIFKIRDKTVTIRSDAETFKDQFDAIIPTITFNK